MKFFVSDEVFEKLPDVCFAIVAAKGINNMGKNPDIENLLKVQVENTHQYFKDKNVKEYDKIICYREAFQTLGINPNKFMCSIEALSSRISKKAFLPSINPIVDLVNVVSLKYVLPMGAHNIGNLCDDICIRFSSETDTFLPMGQDKAEIMEARELVYASGSNILTRRWIWRQSDIDKADENSSTILFPIDGFKSINYQALLEAKTELEQYLKSFFGVDTIGSIIDKDNREFDLSLL